MFLGNIFVFFKFRGLDKIDKESRVLVMWVLFGICVVGVVVLVLLPRFRSDSSSDEIKPVNRTPGQALKDAMKLFTTKDMILLSCTFFYTGL